MHFNFLQIGEARLDLLKHEGRDGTKGTSYFCQYESLKHETTYKTAPGQIEGMTDYFAANRNICHEEGSNVQTSYILICRSHFITRLFRDATKYL